MHLLTRQENARWLPRCAFSVIPKKLRILKTCLRLIRLPDSKRSSVRFRLTGNLASTDRPRSFLSVYV